VRDVPGEAMTYSLVHETRDEGGRWLYEMLDDEIGGQFFRRRPGQSRRPITLDELQAAMTAPEPEPDHNTCEPASVWERPNFGPRRHLR
jgi:hypothetical protein